MSDIKNTRLRVRFARLGEAARLSHLEQIRQLRVIAAASGLPCASNGNGKKQIPKMAFGPAISVGYESEAEYADLYLTAPLLERDVFAKLSAACGGGFAALGVKRIPLHFPSLESLLNAAEYELTGDFGADSAASLEKFLSQPEIPVIKQKHDGPQERIDAKPLIIAMKQEDGGKVRLVIRFGPGRNLKPELILRAWLGVEAQPPGQPSGNNRGEQPRNPVVFGIIKKHLYWETPNGLSAP